MKDTVQLNTDISDSELRKVKRDAVDIGTPMREYVRVALLHFRQSLTIEQRRQRFSDKSQKKILGRPISA